MGFLLGYMNVIQATIHAVFNTAQFGDPKFIIGIIQSSTFSKIRFTPFRGDHWMHALWPFTRSIKQKPSPYHHRPHDCFRFSARIGSELVLSVRI
jgi:hypothetical protein